MPIQSVVTPITSNLSDGVPELLGDDKDTDRMVVPPFVQPPMIGLAPPERAVLEAYARFYAMLNPQLEFPQPRIIDGQYYCGMPAGLPCCDRSFTVDRWSIRSGIVIGICQQASVVFVKVNNHEYPAAKHLLWTGSLTRAREIAANQAEKIQRPPAQARPVRRRPEDLVVKPTSGTIFRPIPPKKVFVPAAVTPAPAITITVATPAAVIKEDKNKGAEKRVARKTKVHELTSRLRLVGMEENEASSAAERVAYKFEKKTGSELTPEDSASNIFGSAIDGLLEAAATFGEDNAEYQVKIRLCRYYLAASTILESILTGETDVEQIKRHDHPEIMDKIVSMLAAVKHELADRAAIARAHAVPSEKPFAVVEGHRRRPTPVAPTKKLGGGQNANKNNNQARGKRGQ